MALNDLYRKKAGHDLDASGPLADLKVLSFDEDLCWWEDLEADVLRGNNAYVRVLQEWSRISRGAFRPDRIEER